MSEELVEVASQLSTKERQLLIALRSMPSIASLEDLSAKASFFSIDETFSTASWLQKKGILKITEKPTRTWTIGPEGKKFAEKGFPEQNLLLLLRTRDGSATLGDLKKHFQAEELEIALKWWKRKSFGRIERKGSDIVIEANPSTPSADDESLLIAIRSYGEDGWNQETGSLQYRPEALELLRTRPGVLEFREAKQRFVELSPLGKSLLGWLDDAAEIIGELSPELIRSGRWKNKDFQSYSIKTAVPRTLAGKPHPLMQIIEEVRTIFLELGFQEIEEDFVQSAFWNLDALFIPQDHPAREMQDTFYLQTPSKVPVEADLVERISKVHESGGDTGSRGWGAPLDPDESRRALLRTHTTVGTIKYLAKNPQGPTRVFSIGRVFRKETMDATHLPEFHQIEGIATEPGADFRMLLGILQEFYRRLGFEKLRWRPAYFPYTEPSMEVEVWTGKKWMELGGCGIFRPEVTGPFGVKTPVLAWGLGLERLAMLRLGLSDIRNLYISDLEWLRNQPLL